MQQTHGSLRSQCDASVCHFELRCVLGGGRGSHSRCSRTAGSLRLQWEPFLRCVKPRLALSRKGDSPLRCSGAAAPFGRSESPSISRISLHFQHRTGLPFRCSRAAGSLRLHGSPPSDESNRASNILAYSVSDGALLSGEAEPQLPSVAAREPHICRWSHAAYSATDGTLPSGAAEPQLPSDAVRVPPSVTSLCFLSIGLGSPSGAADPRLPPVAG